MKNFNADPAAYQQQLSEKTQRITELFSPYYEDQLEIFSSPLCHYRARAEFRVWHDGDDLYHIMFDQENKEKYRVDEFPVALKIINELMTMLIEKLKPNEVLRRKLFQIDYLSGLSGETVISLLYHKPLDDAWLTEINKLKADMQRYYHVDFVGRSRKQKLIVDREHITERLTIAGKDYLYRHIENSFTQPNPYINQQMIEWCLEKTANSQDKDLLEFYCGAGNFSIPLAQNFRKVVGTEISRTSVAAAQHNIMLNNADNVVIARMSSEEFTEFYRNKKRTKRLEQANIKDLDISTVLVDPPRAGLDKETIALIRDYPHILYISCNPETLIDNIGDLHSTHAVKELALFDQFPYTHHIETGVLLTRR